MENKLLSVGLNGDAADEVKKTIEKSDSRDEIEFKANVTVNKSDVVNEKRNDVQKTTVDESLVANKKVDEVETSNGSVILDKNTNEAEDTVAESIVADENGDVMKTTIEELVLPNKTKVKPGNTRDESDVGHKKVDKVEEKSDAIVAVNDKEIKVGNLIDETIEADKSGDVADESDVVNEKVDVVENNDKSVDENEDKVDEPAEITENMEEESFSDLEDDGFEFGESKDEQKPTKDEYSVAKWLKANVPTKKTKFLNHHVEYFTGSKAVDALLASKFANGKNPLFLTRLETTDFLHTMLVHKLFHRAKKVPVSEQELKGKSKKKDLEKSGKSGDEKEGEKSASEGKDKDTKESKEKEKEKEKEKKKRKIRLEMHLEQIFLDSTDAYVWIYDPMPWYYWVCGALVVFGTIGVCMFPLWPATVRKGVYYLSIAAAGFLVMIIVLAILRLVIFCLVWTVTLARHHFWLLPNLTEDVGFFASFWPLYKYEYRGPVSESEKAAKNKKKRKKDKLSDDEGDDKTPLIQEEQQDKASEPVTATDKLTDDNKDNPTPPPEVQTESESENSQRSSTDRDFEMVDPADVDPADTDTANTDSADTKKET